MKIKSINIENHPSLGTFHYSFEDDKLITLLVGKNGCGKTRLIEELYKLLNSGFRLWGDKSYEESKTKIELNILFSTDDCYFLDISTGNLTFKLDYSDILTKNQWQTITVFNADDDTDLTSVLLPKLQLEPTKDGFYKLLQQRIRYSSVLINFEYKPVTTFAEKVDDEEKIQTKSTPAVADEINKLLVATYYTDAIDFKKKTEVGELRQGEKYVGDFDRFVDAYNELFTNKEIIGVEVENGDNKIKILNKDTGRTFGIEGLSSGEQQVVYRVGYLLKNLNIKTGGVVFIDEPELSLHPEWQVGYIPFLQKIFGADIQFILATHSPYIVKSGCLLNDVEISRLYNEEGNLINEAMDKTSKLGKASYAEVGYKVFAVNPEEYHQELYLALTAKLQVGETPTQIDKELMKNKSISTVKTSRGTETIMSFVRNIYHHGAAAIEQRGRMYTCGELKQSILEIEGLL